MKSNQIVGEKKTESRVTTGINYLIRSKNNPTIVIGEIPPHEKVYGSKTEALTQGMRNINEDYNTLQQKHDSLQEAYDQLKADFDRLLSQRTQELENSNSELKKSISNLTKAQDQLIESEKLGALGLLVGGISHQINTPLGAITSSAEILNQTLKKSFGRLMLIGQKLNEEEITLLIQLEENLFAADFNLSSREQRQLTKEINLALQTDEIPNALLIAQTLGDLGFTQDFKTYYPLFKNEKIGEILKVIRETALEARSTANIRNAARKIDKVVTALATYNDSLNESEKREFNVIESLESVLELYKGMIKQGVTVRKNYSSDQVILKGYSNQVNQIWINLIHNALQAMDNSGTLVISVTTFDDLLFVTIEDNGPGIPFEIQSKIFEPFFTTKSSGYSTGLGLNLVRKIVNRHAGELNLESEPGKTTFTISIPGVQVDENNSFLKMLENF